MTIKYYVLDGKTVRPEPDLVKWAEWFETANRIVRKDRATVRAARKVIDSVDVATVFLGFDHQIGEGPPLLFETTILGGPLDKECDRCSTWEAAEKMHEKMPKRVLYAAFNAG